MSTPNQCQFWDCNETIPRGHFLCGKENHYAGYTAGTIDKCPACGQYKDAEYDVCRKCYQQTASAWGQRPSAAGQRAGYADDGLLEELRSLRRGLAQASDIQDYMVFNDDTLRQMTERRPTTTEAMLAINGVGPVKMERYGSEFLKVIRENTGRNTKRQDSQPPRQRNAVQRDNREFTADKDADRFFVYILLMNNGEYYVGQTREIHERLHEHRNNMSKSTKGRKPKLQWFTTVQTRKEAADLEAELQQMNSNPAGRREINRWVVDFKRLSDELDYELH